jgi:cytochrome b6-f complex iron-sulfur subunit
VTDASTPVNSWTLIGLCVAVGVAAIFALLIARDARRRSGPAQPAGTASVGGVASVGGGQDLAVGAVAGDLGPMSRRELLNRGIVGGFTAALAGVGASFVAFVWPTVDGSTGARYAVGGLGDLRRRLAVDKRPYVGGHGHFYLVPFPAERLVEARSIYPPAVLRGMEVGLVALSPVCTHQGCQVPFCASSAWFECPCHGSRYDGVGEQRRGPAPRGLDHYAVTIEGGTVVVDTRRRYLGLPPGTETVDDPAAGPHCY